MQVTTYTVNEQGLNEIKEFLAANHKKGGDHFTRDMLQASPGRPATSTSRPAMTDTKQPPEKRHVGRPAEVGGKRVQVYLDKASLEAAARLGNGNVSEGIRRALRAAEAQAGGADDAR